MLDKVKTPQSNVQKKSIYDPIQTGLIYPEIQQFDNYEAERLHRKQRLVAACRAFALEGFDYGFAGHLTIRDPERPELYWTNPMCVHFAQVKVSNLILADHKGQVLEGKHAINRAGFVLHAAVHEAHPDIISMCHAHTVYGTAFAALGRPLEPISQDAAAFFEDHIVIKDEAGQVAVEEKAGLAVCDWFEGVKAAIHQNHGLLTASRHSIEAAAFWFIALERWWRLQDISPYWCRQIARATAVNTWALSTLVGCISNQFMSTWLRRNLIC
jgi:ribulose-5-phosphate 4-epimerase/fuculose-1-phosphate aldolase